jgi:CubicO group peptidase (beta-lactamase class C family)
MVPFDSIFRATRSFVFIVIAALTIAGCVIVKPAPTVTSADRLQDKLRAIVNDAAQPLASVSTLVVRDGRVVFEGQAGRQLIDDAAAHRNLAATRDTIYRIASISKLITTLGVMRLVEEGKLALDVDVSTYLGWSLRNPHFPDAPITMRMLLSHQASILDDAGYYWEDALNVSLKDVFTPGASRYGTGLMWAKNAKPGDYFSYGNLNWGLIGTVMERVSGERFDRLMKRTVFDPLGIRAGFNPAEMAAVDVAKIATLYRKRVEVNGKEIWNPSGPWIAQVDDYSQTAPVPRAGPNYVPGTNGTLFGPQGACRLSAADLGRVMLMLMNEGEFEGRRVLSSTSVREMLREQWRANSAGSNGDVNSGGGKQLMNAWGLGNQHFLDLSGPARGDRLIEAGGFTAVGHLGDAWGLTSAFVFDPKTKNGMIFLTSGPGVNPETTPGKYSAFHRYEERILSALHEHALR